MSKDRKQLLEEVMVQVGELYRLFATTRDKFLAQFELSRPQAELLFLIKHGKRTTSELAEAFSITPSAVSQMVRQLEEKQLVIRTADEEDRRVTYIQLAPRTYKTFEKIRSEFSSHLQSRFSEVGTKELERFLHELEKVNKTLG